MNLKITVDKVGEKGQPRMGKVTEYAQLRMKAKKKGLTETHQTEREAIKQGEESKGEGDIH